MTVLGKLSFQGINACEGPSWTVACPLSRLALAMTCGDRGTVGPGPAAEVTPCPLSAVSTTALPPISTPTEPLTRQGDSLSSDGLAFPPLTESRDQLPSPAPLSLSPRFHALALWWRWIFGSVSFGFDKHTGMVQSLSPLYRWRSTSERA